MYDLSDPTVLNSKNSKILLKKEQKENNSLHFIRFSSGNKTSTSYHVAFIWENTFTPDFIHSKGYTVVLHSIN